MTTACCLECNLVAGFVLGSFRDVQQKAKRLRDSGRIKAVSNQSTMVSASVEGDHGTYDVEIYRQFPGSKSITMWSCTCPWGDWAFKRQHTYVGRTCSHALAVFFETQSRDYIDKDDYGYFVARVKRAIEEVPEGMKEVPLSDLQEGDTIVIPSVEAMGQFKIDRIEQSQSPLIETPEHRQQRYMDAWDQGNYERLPDLTQEELGYGPTILLHLDKMNGPFGGPPAVKVWKVTTSRVSDRRDLQLAVKTMVGNDPMSTEEIANQTGLTTPEVRDVLNSLQSKGEVNHGSDGLWYPSQRVGGGP